MISSSIQWPKTSGLFWKCSILEIQMFVKAKHAKSERRFQDSVGGEVGLPLRGWLADLKRLVGRCGAFHPIQGNASSMHLTQFKEMHLTPTENWHRHHLFFEIALGQKVWTPRYIFWSRSHIMSKLKTFQNGLFGNGQLSITYFLYYTTIFWLYVNRRFFSCIFRVAWVFVQSENLESL